MRKMVNFEISCVIKKDIIHFVIDMGQRKKVSH